MPTTQKKTVLTEFKILGLFSLKTKIKEWNFLQFMVFIVVILIFLLTALVVLKSYVLPTFGVPAVLSQIPKFGIGKILKSRSP